ncbi:hypothetical protein LLG95_13200 [bacterium]|nr:hypothetical protein [bacterium]
MRISVFVGIMWIACSAAFAQPAVPPAHGDGLTTATAYQLTQLGNLVWLGDEAKASRTAGKYYRLMDDIDASETASWNDPGTTTDILEGFIPITPFDGIFEGSGHTIKNLTINRSSAINGLFGNIGSNARVSNLNLVGFSISGDQLGCLAGYNCGTVVNCRASGIVEGYIAGGLIGANANGVIRECAADGLTTGTDSAGGLVGASGKGTILNCATSGTVSSSHYGGGLIGRTNSDQVSDCHSTSAVRAYESGGLIGSSNNTTVTKCFATGNVSGYWASGGLIGNIYLGSISLCYATGDTAGYCVAGGLTGIDREAVIENCYASGFVERIVNMGSLCYGGLCGDVEQATIKNCYSTGKLSDKNYSGGLIGWNQTQATNSYWDYETAQVETSDGGTSKTTQQMRTQATFENWDFEKTWGIQNGYPYLMALPNLRVTYVAANHGSLSEGELKKYYIYQTLNVGASGMAVTAVPDPGFEFAGWSDGRTESMRTDKKVMAAMNVTAYFRSTRNAAGEWFLYR